MVVVYFEYKGYAEKVAQYENEDEYISDLKYLEGLCIENGFERITEQLI